MAIITISRQPYSLGEEIAQKVADDLGYDFIDKKKIGEALLNHGIPGAAIERYDEKKPTIWDSLIIQQSNFLYTIRALIYEFAGRNDTVILGRGAQVLLKDLPGALHVRVFAPLAVRLKRLMERKGYDEKNGEKILRQGDRDSSGFIRSFFGADWNNPDLYDILINTKSISIDTAAEMIQTAIDSPEFKGGTKEILDKLVDLSLQQQAESIVKEIQKNNDPFVVVASVEKGVVTLAGITHSIKVKEDCEQEISRINGVVRIINDISIVKPMLYSC